MNSHSEWDRAQEEWRRNQKGAVRDHHRTGHAVKPSPELPRWEPVEDEPMPDYEEESMLPNWEHSQI